MATTNHRSRSGGNGNKKSTSVQAQSKEAVAQIGEKVSHVREEMAGYVSQGAQQFGHMTRGHEGQAALIALAAGFGVGLVIGCSLASSHRKPQSWTERLMSDGFGRKFMARVEQMLPEAIADHFGR